MTEPQVWVLIAVFATAVFGMLSWQTVSFNRTLRTEIGAVHVVMETRFTSVERRLAGIEGRVTAIEGRMTAIEERVTTIESRVTGIEGRVTELDRDVQALTRRAFGADAAEG